MPPTKSDSCRQLPAVWGGNISYWGCLRVPVPSHSFPGDPYRCPGREFPLLPPPCISIPGSLFWPCENTTQMAPPARLRQRLPAAHCLELALQGRLVLLHHVAQQHVPCSRCSPARHSRTWPSHRPHSKTPSSGGIRTPVRHPRHQTSLSPPSPHLPSLPRTFQVHPLTWTTFPREIPSHPQPLSPLPDLSCPSHPKSWPHWACLGPPYLHGGAGEGGGQPLR